MSVDLCDADRRLLLLLQFLDPGLRPGEVVGEFRCPRLGAGGGIQDLITLSLQRNDRALQELRVRLLLGECR